MQHMSYFSNKSAEKSMAGYKQAHDAPHDEQTAHDKEGLRAARPSLEVLSQWQL